MRAFVCLLDPAGRGIDEAARRPYESLPRSRGLAFRWRTFERAAVLTAWKDSRHEPLLTCDGPRLIAGTARIDNRGEVESLAKAAGTGLTDLQLVLRAVTICGPACVARLLGDFAFIAWDPASRSVAAACDALAVRKLYYSVRGGLLAFASHAGALAQGDRYNLQYIAEQVAGAEATPELTVYDGVNAVPAGTVMWLERGMIASRQYWSPEQIDQSPAGDSSEEEAAATLRSLLLEAVRARLGNGGTWAQLSGGLDSSSVVSMAQWLVENGSLDHGLAGTVTYVDRAATPADERTYSDVVVARWGLRNETIVDPPMWYDERYGLPQLDQPRPNLMFYPREARLLAFLSAAKGRVLLTGQGPDEYLRGNMYFFADWLASGRITEAFQEMLRRASIGRVSFWELAYRNALVPLIPGALQRWFGPALAQLPAWVRPEIARRFDLRRRRSELALSQGPVGGKYRHAVVRSLVAVGTTSGHLLLDDHLDVRHPFLDRRVMEYGLRLPPQLTSRPYASKWVLREAMRGIVPEIVRTRIGKGTQSERYAWSLTAQRALLEPLVDRPMLAELGVIESAALRAAFDAAPSQGQRRGDPHAVLQQVLAIEAWLQTRAGRWPRGKSH